jgi:hypothetical protein
MDRRLDLLTSVEDWGMSGNHVAQTFYLSVCLVWSGMVWSGLVWSGLVWSGLVWSVLGKERIRLTQKKERNKVRKKEINKEKQTDFLLSFFSYLLAYLLT